MLSFWQKGHMSWDCREKKYSNNKIYKKGEKAIDGEEDNLVLCFLAMENRRENVKQKVLFAEDVKQPSEAGLMCTIDGDSFFSFTKNTWIGDFGALCHIMNDNMGLFNIMDINEFTQ